MNATTHKAIEILELAIQLAETGLIIPLRAARIQLGESHSPAAQLAEESYTRVRVRRCPDRKPNIAEIADLFREAISELRDSGVIPDPESNVTPTA